MGRRDTIACTIRINDEIHNKLRAGAMNENIPLGKFAGKIVEAGFASLENNACDQQDNPGNMSSNHDASWWENLARWAASSLEEASKHCDIPEESKKVLSSLGCTVPDENEEKEGKEKEGAAAKELQLKLDAETELHKQDIEKLEKVEAELKHYKDIYEKISSMMPGVTA